MVSIAVTLKIGSTLATFELSYIYSSTNSGRGRRRRAFRYLRRGDVPSRYAVRSIVDDVPAPALPLYWDLDPIGWVGLGLPDLLCKETEVGFSPGEYEGKKGGGNTTVYICFCAVEGFKEI